MLRSEPKNAEFLGGPPELFERAGREQLIVLLEYGMTFQSTVLDVGCGCLRGGRWIIPLLDRGHYYGIEPQQHMVERGLKEFVSPEIVALKEPHFDYNDRFDFTVFGVKFSHFLLRSIWTHASKSQIDAMLTGFAETAEPNGVMLTSFRPAGLFDRHADYDGASWVGKSHESSEGGMVTHRFTSLQAICAQHGLQARLMPREPLARQAWLEVTRAGSYPDRQLRSRRVGLFSRWS